ncbi:hypothetical protein ACV34H_33185, partial [Pseudomonas aeruginosa]
MNAVKPGELAKGEVRQRKAKLPTLGALADAEGAMPYTHPVKEAAKTKVPDPPPAAGNFTRGPLENSIKTIGRFTL